MNKVTVALLGMLAVQTVPAMATQYDVVPLDAQPSGFGQARGIWRGQAVGALTDVGGVFWPSPSGYVSLNPGGQYTGVLVLGIFGNQQVGAAGLPGSVVHAALWSGTATSFQDLNPAGLDGSIALATDGQQQVGAASNDQAALWSGSAASYVNLGPAGAVYPFSYASGVWNGMQVGYSSASGGAVIDALEWHGTADSLTILKHGAAAMAISRGQVVGLVHGATNDAALWTDGTPASFQDIAPAGATASELFGTNGTQQVGDVSLMPGSLGQLPGDHHPAVWHGTAASAQLLPLPSGENEGQAYAIDGYGDVAGFAAPSSGTAFNVPVLWTPHRLPGDADFDGTVGFDDLVILARHYGGPGEWVDGDFTMDGTVGFADLVVLARNYGASQTTTLPYGVQTLPECSAVPLLIALATTGRRRDLKKRKN